MMLSRDTHKTKAWRTRIQGEPSLVELMNDPLTHLLMRRDGIDPAVLRDVIDTARRGLRHPEVRPQAA